MRQAIIACGGTGGHLSPGIALAEELIADGWECKLLISNKQVDSRMVRKYSDFSYESVPGSPMGLSPVKLVRFAWNLISGVWRCLSIYKRKRPDVVIGFGGFLSMPALLAAFFARVPSAIHEANRVPGRVTRLASWFVTRIYLPAGVHVKTARSSRIRHVGMPVRHEITPLPSGRARVELGLDANYKTLVVVGGSQGARSLNEWVKSNVESLADESVQVYCLMGPSGGTNSRFTFKSKEGQEVSCVFEQFSDRMSYVLSAADLVVTRAGAGSLSEIARCRAPAVLIPYPYAADDHQQANAAYFERQGAGVMVQEDSLGDLLVEVKDLIHNDWLLSQFKSNMKSVDRFDQSAFMVHDLDNLSHRRIDTRYVRFKGREGVAP